MIQTILIKLVTKIFGFKKTHWKIYKTLLIIITPLLIITIATSFSLDLQAAGLSNGLDAFNLSMNGTPTVNSKGTQAILDWCRVIAEYMRDNHYFYPRDDKTGELDPNKKGITYDIKYNDGKSKACCCATYVSWVLQEAGYIEESQHTNLSSTIGNLLTASDKWDDVTNTIKDISNLQAGDVLIYKDGGHTNIYAGDSKYWDAGTDSPDSAGAFIGEARTSNQFGSRTSVFRLK